MGILKLTLFIDESKGTAWNQIMNIYSTYVVLLEKYWNEFVEKYLELHD